MTDNPDGPTMRRFNSGAGGSFPVENPDSLAWPAPNAAEWEPMPCYSCGSFTCDNFDYCDQPRRSTAELHPIVELLDQITDEFLQADGKDMFHVKALADTLRRASTPENTATPTDGYPSVTEEP